MDGASVIRYLKKKLSLGTDKQLADKLGISPAGLQGWKRQDDVTALQVAGLVSAGVRETEIRTKQEVEANAVKPIVEFFPLNKCQSRGGTKYELFDSNDGHLYLQGLRKELAAHHGVYVFSDSRGHAIYVGKARDQPLWNEMNAAFNRQRDVQKIMRVAHPERNQAFKTSDEKKRQIRETTVKLHDIAMYFSAYQVADGMINSLEAMLVRCFANDLLNVRMEKLGG